jgi:hypothetical protein
MRGATSHDGKLSGNRQTVDAYDRDKGRGAQRPGNRGGASGGVHEESGHDEIKQVVAEHGKAHKHIIQHSGGGGGMSGASGSESGEKYHSITHHEDGHVHRANHESLDDAHEHGRMAMEDTEHNEMDRDSQELAGERDRSEAGGHNTPGEESFLD